MANTKTTATTPEMKHKLLDIEMGIDEDIAEKIVQAKKEYSAAIAEFKELRSTRIKDIKQEKKQRMLEAVNDLMEA